MQSLEERIEHGRIRNLIRSNQKIVWFVKSTYRYDCKIETQDGMITDYYLLAHDNDREIRCFEHIGKSAWNFINMYLSCPSDYEVTSIT